MAAEPAVSAIVPTLNEAARVDALVTTLLGEGFAEVVVADGGSTDETCARAAEKGARVVRSERGRGAQLHAGALQCRGDVLFFVHADSILPPSARARIVEALNAPHVAAGSFSLAFDCRHWLLDVLAGLSRINHALATYGDQGLFVWRRTYHKIGGYRPMPILEDLEIQRRLRREGRFVKLREPITTSARRYLRDGVMRRQAANVWIVARYLAGIDASKLARDYRLRGDELS